MKKRDALRDQAVEAIIARLDTGGYTLEAFAKRVIGRTVGIVGEKRPTTLGVGSVVALKSGGPKMTVMSVWTNHIVCAWFVEGGACRSEFAPESVRVLP